jgi:molecular chaperone DnaJ
VPTDYYELLEVSSQATSDEIKRSYRRLARQYHPDNNPGDETAEARFKEIALAYEVLSDPDRRARYDQFGPEGAAGGGAGAGFGAGGFGDIFEQFFGGGAGFGGGGRRPSGPPPGADLEARVTLDFEQAVFGAEEPVTVRTAVACETCEATGAAPGTHAETCSQCQGAGQVRQVRQSILGQMVTAGPCPQCNGLGQTIADPCPDCRGEGRIIEERTYNVDIPAGVDSGSTLRLTGMGAVGPRGGATGDLYVHLRVRDHPRFERAGLDLHHDLHIPFTQAVLGAHLPFETLDGEEDLVIPKGTQSGRTFRLRGRGVPHVHGRGRGDLVVTAVVDTPTDLDQEQDELLRRLAELRGEEVAPPDKGVFSKLRSAFK